jgi:hypothetical protein
MRFDAATAGNILWDAPSPPKIHQWEERVFISKIPVA